MHHPYVKLVDKNKRDRTRSRRRSVSISFYSINYSILKKRGRLIDRLWCFLSRFCWSHLIYYFDTNGAVHALCLRRSVTLHCLLLESTSTELYRIARCFSEAAVFIFFPRISTRVHRHRPSETTGRSVEGERKCMRVQPCAFTTVLGGLPAAIWGGNKREGLLRPRLEMFAPH